MRCSGFSYQSLPRIPLPEHWNQHLEIHGAPTMCHDEPPAIDHLADWRPTPAGNFQVSMESKGGSCLCLWTFSGNWGRKYIEILNHYFEMWKYKKEIRRNIPTESSCGENCCLNHPIRSLNKSRQGLWYHNFALSITWRRGDRVQIPSFVPTNPQAPPGTHLVPQFFGIHLQNHFRIPCCGRNHPQLRKELRRNTAVLRRTTHRFRGAGPKGFGKRKQPGEGGPVIWRNPVLMRGYILSHWKPVLNKKQLGGRSS